MSSRLAKKYNMISGGIGLFCGLWGGFIARDE